MTPKKEGFIMASKATGKKPMFGNRRSHALNATRHVQKLNLQNVTLTDGTKVKVTAREAKRYKKDMKSIAE
jgi:large subunit ribosomal protein L28